MWSELCEISHHWGGEANIPFHTFDVRVWTQYTAWFLGVSPKTIFNDLISGLRWNSTISFQAAVAASILVKAKLTVVLKNICGLQPRSTKPLNPYSKVCVETVSKSQLDSARERNRARGWKWNKNRDLKDVGGKKSSSTSFRRRIRFFARQKVSAFIRLDYVRSTPVCEERMMSKTAVLRKTSTTWTWFLGGHREDAF